MLSFCFTIVLRHKTIAVIPIFKGEGGEFEFLPLFTRKWDEVFVLLLKHLIFYGKKPWFKGVAIDPPVAPIPHNRHWPKIRNCLALKVQEHSAFILYLIKNIGVIHFFYSGMNVTHFTTAAYTVTALLLLDIIINILCITPNVYAAFAYTHTHIFVS